ncbi:MAG: oxidoreductase [Actinomycetia bacterium]|nr:oxidoreductase [Actinomycetes bacterium]
MATVTIRSTRLPSGELIPVLGQGTWGMGENAAERAEELRTLRLGLDLGMTLVDTAEMYGDGAAEELVAEAIAGRRDEVFLVSKVLPANATRNGTIEACERTLERLQTDRLDMYLLHWRGRLPLEGTIRAFGELLEAGKIRHWGVSNFDAVDLAEVVTIVGGEAVQTDQVLYNLAHRGVELELLPWCRDWGIPVMAYSPINRGRLVGNDVVVEIAEKHDATPAQIALAWVLRHDDICAIPKASIHEHVRENRRALDLQLDNEDLKLLDEEFPPPAEPPPLEMI